jgi:hypothetical protein
MKRNRGTQILDNFINRLSRTGDKSRKDLSVVGHSLVDEGVRLVLSYVGNPPEIRDIELWAIKFGKGCFKPMVGTLQVHANIVPYPLVSVIVKANAIRIPLEIAKKNENLMAISETNFIDVDLGTMWEVQEMNGKRFIARVVPDTVAEFFESNKMYRGPKTARAVNSILAAATNNGDKVRYYRPDTSIGIGVIMKELPDGLLQIRDTKTRDVYTRPPATVLEVLVSGPQTKQEKSSLQDYFQQYLGDKLGKEITK